MSLNDNWTSKAQDEWNGIDVPQEAVKQSIHQGVLQAKSRKKKRNKRMLTTLVAAALLIITLTSIRVSPAFAQVVGQLPGMERIVAYIQGQQDRGLLTAVENEYYQPIGISQEVNSKILTIDGVIADQRGMVVFYTIEAGHDIAFRRDGEAAKISANGQQLESSYSYNSPDAQQQSRFEDTLHFHYNEPITTDIKDYTLEVFLEDDYETEFAIDFTLPKPIEQEKIYTLNKEVEIDGNRILFKEAVISPLRVGVTLSYNDTNPSSIYAIEKLELRDRSGDAWGTIQNGLSGRGSEDGTEHTYFFQSSYFDEPEDLTLFVDRVQALPKGEDYVLVNFEERKVLYHPPYADMEIEVTGPGSVSFSYEETSDTYHHGSLGVGTTGEGEEVYSYSESFFTYEGRHHFTASFDTASLIGDVRIDFSAFPHYLDGSAEIEIIP